MLIENVLIFYESGAKMKYTKIAAVLGTLVFLSSLSVFAAGEKMINSSAGKSYAGYGYTHGYVPVTVGTGGYYDSDIWKYDINNSQYYFQGPYAGYSSTQEEDNYRQQQLDNLQQQNVQNRQQIEDYGYYR